ncbi:MAG: GH25 family lysozyme [Sphingomonadales bacterium]
MPSRRVRIAAIFVILVVLLAAVIVVNGYQGGWLRFNYPSREAYPVWGLDVSNHQGIIDWPAVPREKVSFVYIKATEGGDWRDKSFARNWHQARKAGFEVGAYHFFTLCRNALTQARNFIDVVKPHPGMLPPAVDLEYGGNCGARPSKAKLLAEVRVLIAEWTAFYDTAPVLYVTEEFFRDYVKGSDLESHPLWVRDIFQEPDKADFPSMVMWQFANRARIAGVIGPVDLNVRTD